MKPLFLVFFFILSATAPARTPYRVVKEPEIGLKNFARVTVGVFSAEEFLKKLKEEKAPNLQSYSLLTPEVNAKVRQYAMQAMEKLIPGQGSQDLILDGELLSFRTGDQRGRAAMRMLSAAPGPRGIPPGSGHLDYSFVLYNGKVEVAAFDIIVPIKSNKEGAYRSVSSYVVQFIEDHWD